MDRCELGGGSGAALLDEVQLLVGGIEVGLQPLHLAHEHRVVLLVLRDHRTRARLLRRERRRDLRLSFALREQLLPLRARELKPPLRLEAPRALLVTRDAARRDPLLRGRECTSQLVDLGLDTALCRVQFVIVLLELRHHLAEPGHLG